MTNPSFLNVTSVDNNRTDKNGRKYSYIAVKGDDVETFVFPGGRVVTAIKPAKESAFTAYEENYLGQQDLGWNAKSGQTYMGAIVTRNVPSYDITDKKTDITRSVNTYSAVILGDTRDQVAFEAEVRRVFKSAGHNLDYAEAVQAVAEVEVVDMKG